MGGIRSGRRKTSGRVSIEDSLCLDVRALKNKENYLSQYRLHQTWDTYNPHTKEQSSVIIYMDVYNLKDKNIIACEQRFIPSSKTKFFDLNVERTHPKHGGERLWFKCPITGDRVTKLYLPRGADVFASRQAYRLVYGSQYLAKQTALLRRRKKLEDLLIVEGNYYRRPKGMHQKTFEHLLGDINNADYRVLSDIKSYALSMKTYWQQNPID